MYICVIRDNALYSLCRDIVFLCSFPFRLVIVNCLFVFVFSLFCTTRLVNKVMYVYTWCLVWISHDWKLPTCAGAGAQRAAKSHTHTTLFTFWKADYYNQEMKMNTYLISSIKRNTNRDLLKGVISNDFEWPWIFNGTRRRAVCLRQLSFLLLSGALWSNHYFGLGT